MDAATEPILVVIGHPIAGNPSQFAVERALRAMQLDWRVLSFDVRAEDVASACDGFSVTGIVGVLIDVELQEAAAQWYRTHTDSDLDRVDCLCRDEDGQFAARYQQRKWVNEQVEHHLQDCEEEDSRRIWIGESLQGYPIDAESFQIQSSELPPSPELIESAKLIALTDGDSEPVELEEEDWPEDDGETLVVDLCRGSLLGGHPEIETIEDLGYEVVTAMDQRVGTLLRCLKRWTGNDASGDVIRDAIEEYLGV